MKRVVPVLITWDVDPTPEVTPENKKRALALTLALLSDLQIRSTFLFHAQIAPDLQEEISSLVAAGHEIGCHGLTHGDEEEYDRMAEHVQREYLVKATSILESVANTPIRTFRGPRVKTSHITQKILEELGYCADCSVSSQRIDFISSNLVNVGWIVAPRLPYHPSDRSAFKRGKRNIWVVPNSAIVFPFISTALYTFRLRFMKYLFNILYGESLQKGKPIVYMGHPFEFAPWSMRIRGGSSFFRRVRIHGFGYRRIFCEKNERSRYEMNKALFAYMKSHPAVEFMTVSDFVGGTLHRPGTAQ
ncbi:MAG: polysaccharide deacetylase family protein [Candidatus Eisenbacteria bacterium]